MKIHDVSLTIHPSMAVYGDDPLPEFTAWDVPSDKDSFRSTWLGMLSHTGTHVDAPSHLLAGGQTVDQIDLQRLAGEAIVINTSSNGKMTVKHFEEMNCPLENMIVLLKTGESAELKKGLFRDTYLAPSRELAAFLVASGIKAIGIDTLSIDRTGEVQAHPVFLEAGVPIIEGLDLEGVSPGSYFFACFPLKLKGLDGSPARAVLIENRPLD